MKGTEVDRLECDHDKDHEGTVPRRIPTQTHETRHHVVHRIKMDIPHRPFANFDAHPPLHEGLPAIPTWVPGPVGLHSMFRVMTGTLWGCLASRQGMIDTKKSQVVFADLKPTRTTAGGPSSTTPPPPTHTHRHSYSLCGHLPGPRTSGTNRSC